MNQHLSKVIEIYEDAKVDFHSLLNWHLCHGIVVSDFDVFAMGFCVRKDDPTFPVPIYHSDTLFVTMYCGDMRKFLTPFIPDFEFIAFQRSFKNSPRMKVYPMDQIIKKLI